MNASLASLRGVPGPVFGLAWSPDGARLAMSGFVSEVKLWDEKSGQSELIRGGTEQPRFVLGWSVDGRQVLLGGLEVPVEAWAVSMERADGRREVARPEGPSAGISLIARTTRGASVRLWGSTDLRSNWIPRSGHQAHSVAFSPDGRSIATAESDLSVRIWEANSGRLRHRLKGDPRGVSGVAFSPDGSTVTTAGGGGVNLWDVESGRLMSTLGRTDGGWAVLAFSPDGGRVAGAGWDGTIRIWDLATRLERSRFGGHDGQILAMAWSPDGRKLASGCYDSTVKVWEVDGPIEVARAD